MPHPLVHFRLPVRPSHLGGALCGASRLWEVSATQTPRGEPQCNPFLSHVGPAETGDAVFLPGWTGSGEASPAGGLLSNSRPPAQSWREHRACWS